MIDLDLRFGDCLEILKQIPDDSVDLVCTDPPYGYSFMNKDWDKAVPRVEIWKECLRVLKPGCFAFVMSAPRSDVQAEMILKLKEAGFEVGFTPIYWAYASGFPKASNISKMVDKRLGLNPIKGNEKIAPDGKPYSARIKEGHGPSYGDSTYGDYGMDFYSTIPNSEEAKQLDGLFGGFQPKPAVEIILVAMKPLSEKTFVEQALKNGHGGTWLGRCRIPYASEQDQELGKVHNAPVGTFAGGELNRGSDTSEYRIQSGRFPGNLLVSDNVLDNGLISKAIPHNHKGETLVYGNGKGLGIREGISEYNDVGGFSRYFSLDAWWEKQVKELPEEQQKTFPFLITPKASKSEKNKGCEDFEVKPKCLEDKMGGLNCGMKTGSGNDRNVLYKNHHPTVKPLKLMQYLVTLGCNKGEIVLDPFVGSGTTCIASKIQGRKSIGIEMNLEYFEIAKARCKPYQEQKELK